MKGMFKKFILKLMSLGFFNWLGDELFCKWKFELVLGYKPNFREPSTFNEKINYLKLYATDSSMARYVDKFEVRSYIEEKIGSQYLVPLIAKYDSVEDITWQNLPNRFVLKCSSGSGGNVICKNKVELDIKKEKEKLKYYCNYNYYYVNRERQYKNIKPCIVCEEFISDTDITPDDYKVYCFSGKARLLEFHIDRFAVKEHLCDYYDELLNKLDFRWGTKPSNIELPYKDMAKKIIELSELIAKDFLHARVDWYVVANKIYFGEITLHNGGGYEKFNSYNDDLWLGSFLHIPCKNEKQEM